MNNFMPELVGAKSDKGPVRPANEDAYWVSHAEVPTEFGALYIVADGVGGQEAGDIAAQKAAEIISETFYTQRQSGTDICAALEAAIRRANQIVLELGQARGVGKMGCTVVTAVVHEGYLYVAHVGDARAYLLMGSQLKRLTRDDTWVQKQVEAGVITPKQAAEHELRNVVTQVLGNKEDIDVHLTQPIELHTNDIFLLCSDGLYDPLNFKQIQRLLHGKSAQAAAEDLVQASIDAQTHDNVTAVVVSAGQIPNKTGPRTAATPAAAGLSGIPLWVVASLLVTVLIFLAILFFFVLPAFNARQSRVEATAVPEVMPSAEVAPAETEIPALLIAPTTEAETAVPFTTATIAATATLDLLPTPTPNPTDTPPPDLAQARGCITPSVLAFVWQEAQLVSCNDTAVANTVIESGQEVIILDTTARTASEPANCTVSSVFLNVQSIETPSLAGWVLESNVQLLSPGESCGP